MANKIISNLTPKTSPASSDVLAIEDTEATKKIDYNALADAILNKITSKTYSVAGSTQTLISAIDALNSNLMSKAISATSIDDLANKIIAMPQSYTATLFVSSNVTSALIPNASVVGKGYVAKVNNGIADIYLWVSNADECYTVRFNPTDKTHTPATKVPTRSEIDALNNSLTNTRTSVTPNSDYFASGNIYVDRMGNQVTITGVDLKLSAALPNSLITIASSSAIPTPVGSTVYFPMCIYNTKEVIRARASVGKIEMPYGGGGAADNTIYFNMTYNAFV